MRKRSEVKKNNRGCKGGEDGGKGDRDRGGEYGTSEERGKQREGQEREEKRSSKGGENEQKVFYLRAQILVPCRVRNASTVWQFLLTLTVECAMYLLNGSSYSL